MLIIATLLAIHLIISPYLFSEGEEIAPLEEHTSIKAQMKVAIKFGLTNPVIRDLLILGAAIGLTMATIEAYWQPHLFTITGGPTYVAFGWVTAGYFAIAIAGHMLIGILAEAGNISANVQVKVLPILLAVIMYILAIRANFGPFIGAYLAFMLVLSMINPPTATLLNNESTDDIRSTMLSLFSFVMQVGGVLSTFGFAYVVKTLGVSTTWIIIAATAITINILRIVQGIIQAKSGT